MEFVRVLRYKLRMMGVSISGPTYTYGDNVSVIHKTQRPESMLTKKSNSIAYQAYCEYIAMNEMRTAHIRSHENIANLATKVHGEGQKKDHLVPKGLYNIAVWDHIPDFPIDGFYRRLHWAPIAYDDRV